MDLKFPLLTLIFAFLIFLFMTIRTIQKSKTNNSTPNKIPPGPWTLPLIGNLHQFMSGSLPHHLLRDLAKEHGPLMHLKLGQVSTIIVSSPEIAQQVLKTHDIIFSHRPSLLSLEILSYNHKDIVAAPYGNYWRQMRKICTIELLSAKRVQSFRSIREEEVSKLIKTIIHHGSRVINLSEKLFGLTYGIISTTAFGSKCKDEEAFKSITMEANKSAAGFCIADFYPSVKIFEVINKSKLEQLHRESDGILQRIINEHREKRSGAVDHQEDLVDVFLKLQKNDDVEFSISDNNIKAVIWDIFSAGSETSSTAVEWAMAEMLRNPRVMKKAQAEVRRIFDGKGNVDESNIHELKFLNSVIKETLRLHPPSPLFPRKNIESCEINGYEIPENSRVLINVWAIGRDPKYWSDAETFFPERFLDSTIDYKGTDLQYIPFGAGRRICPGMSFALPNIELPLAQLLYHFDWKLPNGMKPEDLDMTEAFGVTIRRKTDLLLIPIPYRPTPDIE